MNNFKLSIKYDGSRYYGWQRLKQTDQTIQQKIEEVLSRMTHEKIELLGSGRTDAGVHALEQIANFKTHTNMKEKDVREYCNTYLPKDIVIERVEKVEDRFHARYQAKSKKYLYRIWQGEVPSVFDRKYTYPVKEALDLEAMRKASNYFIGEHDFRAFCSKISKNKSSVRQIYDIKIEKVSEEVQILFHGNGFLYNMVRIMVGTLIEVGCGIRKPEEMVEILKGKVRSYAGPKALAQGLFLYKVYYE